jgi:transcriptional regulatory protein RtcR
MLRRIVFGMLGTQLDYGPGPDRWISWRPSVALCAHEDLLIDRLELLYPVKSIALAEQVRGDIATCSPETQVVLHPVDQADPWDFQEVFGSLHDFATAYTFDPEAEEYLVHMTTGTHVAQICLFLLTEARYFPAKLLQTSPPKKRKHGAAGEYRIIDLDLSRYDAIASRFAREQRDAVSFLKSGIGTRNAAFNALIELIEQVAVNSPEPILLMGETGAGKSQLARRIFELKKSRNLVKGAFVEVNCATIRGDAAMSALFGHTRGAFTGAAQSRPGLLRRADGGVLFLDEIGELGPDEQAMLLRAMEEHVFLPLGSDTEVRSEFQLIAGTNRDLAADVRAGRFREDLLARINLWTFRLPPLRERREDIEPNLDYELQQHARRSGKNVTINREARELFLRFATSPDARWSGNFRDLSAAVTRMATLCPGGRIAAEAVAAEVGRLAAGWEGLAAPGPGGAAAEGGDDAVLAALLGPDRVRQLDLFDRVQLAEVLRVCGRSRTLSEAGRALFSVSRQSRSSTNDADRLRKYLARFGLDWRQVAQS